ncbi:hypothetical protein I79_004022 [Cricetulus griseus]|uniref:Uncharacterized protein n=1 Tax=Cricetulus griseus TaxID=10029 RepID=G3H1J4_CRIGR|nr:hypothetical protein I79_004022 [Cricetulus griseus]
MKCISAALTYPVKVLPLLNGENFKHCIILRKNCTQRTWSRALVAHAFNPSSREADAGRSL